MLRSPARSWVADRRGASCQPRLSSQSRLASVLMLNGPWISEASDANVEDLDFERGHRTLKTIRNGDEHATTSVVRVLLRFNRTLGCPDPAAGGGRRLST